MPLLRRMRLLGASAALAIAPCTLALRSRRCAPNPAACSPPSLPPSPRADYTKLPDVKSFSQPRIRRAVDPSAYVIDPEDAEVRMWRNRVRDYVESDAFKVRGPLGGEEGGGGLCVWGQC